MALRHLRLSTYHTESYLSEKSSKSREERSTSALYDSNLVTNKITKPNPKADRIHIALIDNSGSNSVIAHHLRSSSGYFTGIMNTIDAASQIAFMYCSDHGDGDNFIQEVDYQYPNKEGDKALYSSLHHVCPANGFDSAEAFECSLLAATKLDFCAAKHKHLYLITDVVGHGMGMSSDDGCPHQVQWRDSVKKVYKTFDTFEVIGCGCDEETGKLQAQFLKPERVLYDLIDLSSIQEHEHRAAITSNALLFLIARKTGFQGISLFLSYLYEKWLQDPIFGSKTDERAKEMIQRFGKFIEAPETEIKQMMNKIFV